MSHFDSDTFRQEVIDIVRQIPRGRVLTYGLIARLAGYPLHARHVGKALHGVEDKTIPCHRVVNSVGRTAPDWPEQRLLLEKEGVHFKSNGNVDLRHTLWEIASHLEA